MAYAARIEACYQPQPLCQETNFHHTQEVFVSPASLTSRMKSRMIPFIFRRRTKRTEQQQLKSWPGHVDCVVSPMPTPASRSASTTCIAIPRGVAVSIVSASGQRQTDRRLARQGAAGGSSSGARWRQRQTYCANCERLFFTSLSSLSSAAGAFCSLDCKTNLEYMHQLQHVTCTQTWESSCTISSGSGDVDAIENGECCDGRH